MSKIQAIIFDLDGTLLNTIADIGCAVNGALQKNGFSTHTVEEYANMVGHGLKNLVTQALPSGVNDEVINNVLQDVLVEYELCYAKNTFPYPGISDLLQELMARNIRMSILSNKVDYFTKKIVDCIFNNIAFEEIIGAREGVPKKPDPAAVLEIMEKMNLSADKFLFLGDSGADMKAARAANIKPIGVCWGYRSVEHILESGAEAILDSPLELLNHL